MTQRSTLARAARLLIAPVFVVGGWSTMRDPASLGGHRFWDEDDAEKRTQQRFHFLKNLAILGGLIGLAARG